jgi:hypothetical protein
MPGYNLKNFCLMFIYTTPTTYEMALLVRNWPLKRLDTYWFLLRRLKIFWWEWWWIQKVRWALQQRVGMIF